MANTIMLENPTDFINIVGDIHGTSAANMTSVVEVKHLVKSKATKTLFSDAFKDEIYCTKQENIFIGAKYENAVNNQLIREEKENDFIAESLPWGEWVIPNKIIKHKDAFYVRYYSGMTNNKPTKMYHYKDGTMLTDEEVNLLFSDYVSEKKDGNDHQGTDKEIKPRTIKIENLRSLKLGGNEYQTV